jgi:hypothetical protein
MVRNSFNMADTPTSVKYSGKKIRPVDMNSYFSSLPQHLNTSLKSSSIDLAVFRPYVVRGAGISSILPFDRNITSSSIRSTSDMIWVDRITVAPGL